MEGTVTEQSGAVNSKAIRQFKSRQTKGEPSGGPLLRCIRAEDEIGRQELRRPDQFGD